MKDNNYKFFLIKLGIALLAGWVLLGFVFGLTIMEGEDMYPRIRDGDLMLYYRLQREYHTGDVVTFTRDGTRYTGRIIAREADSVNLGDGGELLINENVQSEEIFYPTMKAEGEVTFPCQVPTGSVFLLCDYRTSGTDSRTYGPVKLKELDGKVISIMRRRGI